MTTHRTTQRTTYLLHGQVELDDLAGCLEGFATERVTLDGRTGQILGLAVEWSPSLVIGEIADGQAQLLDRLRLRGVDVQPVTHFTDAGAEGAR